MTFINSWTENMTGKNSSSKQTVPEYKAATLFPQRKTISYRKQSQNNWSTPSRLVFDSRTIASLKASLGDEEYTPSKSEILTAIIWKSASTAARYNSGTSKRSVMSRAVNIRRRISPPLSPNSVGNIIGHDRTVKDESEVELGGLVRLLRKGLKVFDEKFVKMLKTEEGHESVIDFVYELARDRTRDDAEFYLCSSLCNISLYDIDFGWGRPSWVTVPLPNFKNLIVLIDSNKGDGSVEALVNLSEEDKYLFERDPELLAFASLNPSIVEDSGSRIIKSSM